MKPISKEQPHSLDDLCDALWDCIACLDTPGFFITAEVQQAGKVLPQTIIEFIEGRLLAFREGLSTRKFVFQAEGWRVYLTFFPTDRVVEERYALKNKVLKQRKNEFIR